MAKRNHVPSERWHIADGSWTPVQAPESDIGFGFAGRFVVVDALELDVLEVVVGEPELAVPGRH